MNNYSALNILDYMDVIGEDGFRVDLSVFCSKSSEIEDFMKNAIEFKKRKISITYLLINTEGSGYFALWGYRYAFEIHQFMKGIHFAFCRT